MACCSVATRGKICAVSGFRPLIKERRRHSRLLRYTNTPLCNRLYNACMGPAILIWIVIMSANRWVWVIATRFLYTSENDCVRAAMRNLISKIGIKNTNTTCKIYNETLSTFSYSRKLTKCIITRNEEYNVSLIVPKFLGHSYESPSKIRRNDNTKAARKMTNINVKRAKSFNILWTAMA